MRIASFPELETPPTLRRQVLELHRQAWPGHSVPTAEQGVHDPALHPLSMLLIDGETVLVALDILRKNLVHAGAGYRAGGLSTVVTSETARGRGYGHRLVVAAREAMPGLGLDLGVFTCDRVLQTFYERAGWRLLPGTVLVGGTPEAPFPSDQPAFDKVTLAAFFTARAQADRASFEHARVELHPGEIDKLW